MTKGKRKAVSASRQRIAPRRSRRSGAVAAIMRPIAASPLDSFGIAVAAGLSVAIVINALAFQDGPHPAPIFGSGGNAPAAARSAPAWKVDPTLLSAIQGELARIGQYEGAIDGVYGPRTEAAIRAFQATAGLAATGEPTAALLDILRATTADETDGAATDRPALRPALTSTPPVPAPVPAAPPTATAQAASAPVSSPRILLIQQVLSDQGYGPIRLDGIMGAETRAAILRFEAHRNLPPSGELSPQVLRELSRVSGITLR